MTRVITVLSPDEAAALLHRVTTLDFVDGAASARGRAAEAKHNTQADGQSEATTALVSELRSLLEAHPDIRGTTFPRSFGRIGFNRYCEGDRYGLHVDSPHMGRGDSAMRTDVSFTLFLSELDSYEGGELRIADSGHSASFRLQAGQAVLYPTRLLHEVTPVTRGERVSAIGWIQSWIPDPELRDIAAKAASLNKLLSAPGSPPLTSLLANEVASSLIRYASRG